MFLKKVPQKNGRIYLSIAKNYRRDGMTRTDTIKGLGYLDELEKQYDDPIAFFKNMAKEMTEHEKEAYASRQITIHPMEKIDKRQDGQRKNIGCAVLLSYYNSLGIERTLRNASRAKGFKYDPNAIMRLFVIERILNPGSKRSAVQNSNSYFFRCEFSEDDAYRSLDFFAECKHFIINAMNRSIKNAGKRDMTSVFYDVTNYYFECDREDDLRKVGVNKKKDRSKNPIVQMGLLQDSNAVPITYKTFSGNTHDCTTLLPTLKELKKSYALKDVVVVADKGINTSDNIAACTLDGNDFVFSQSIRGTKSTDELRGWAISDDGYSPNKEGTFKSKSRQDKKTITIRDDKGKAIDKVDVDVKVVAFWSKKYEVRARKKRAEVIARAQELIDNPSAYNRQTHRGAARYVKNITFDKTTGEILKDVGKHALLDEESIADAEACDGYYCIITSKTGWSDDRIIDTYKGLWRIEEAFKITKSDIATRPVHVWTPEHIEAHFLTCFIALCILRLVQYDSNFQYSASSIIDELEAMSGTNEEGNWWLFDHRSDLSDVLCANVGIDLSRKRMRLEDIKKVLTEVSSR